MLVPQLTMNRRTHIEARLHPDILRTHSSCVVCDLLPRRMFYGVLFASTDAVCMRVACLLRLTQPVRASQMRRST